MKLIKKLFIKDYQNIKNPDVRNKYGIVAGTLGIISNIMLFICKLILGLISGSITIIVDAVNNITDALSSILTLIGFKLANKPADKEHPYGHARYEYVMGLIISVIILSIGAIFAKSCIEKIITPKDLSITKIVYIILIISILIKIFQMLMYFNFSKSISSETLKASGIDARNDIITTSTILISMIVMQSFNINIDGYIGLGVSIFIIYSSINLIKDTIGPILSEKPNQELIKLIREEVLSFDGVDDIHDLQIHTYGGGKIYTAIHIEVPATTTLLDSHELVEKITRHFLINLKIHLTIQVDPIDKINPKTNEIYHKVKKAIKSINKELSIHSLRVIYTQEVTKVLFDILEPFGSHLSRHTIDEHLSVFFSDDPSTYGFIYTIEKPLI